MKPTSIQSYMSVAGTNWLRLSFLKQFFVCGLVLALAPVSRAANGNDTWVGNVSANWADSNWTGQNNPPIAGDSLFFGIAGTAGPLLNNDLTAATSFNGLTFNSGASAFRLTGNSITLAGNVTNNGTSMENLDFPIANTALRNFQTSAGGGDIMIGGAMSGAGGGINKYGDGTLWLTNFNTSSGGYNFYQGTVVVTGGALNANGVSSGGAGVAIGALTGLDATLVVSNAFVHATRSSGPSMALGSGAAGCNGALVLGPGAILTNSFDMWLGSAGSPGVQNFGALIVNGGNLTNGSYLVLGRPGGSTGNAANTWGNSRGELIMTSGNINILSHDFSVGCYQVGYSNTSVATFSGGNMTISSGNFWIGQYANGILNVSGNAVINDPSTTAGLRFCISKVSGQTGPNGTVNLNGGTIITSSTTTAGNGNSVLNFNGGTLKANSANTGFINGLTAAYVFGGGVVIDDSGFNLTVPQTLLSATAGQGVSLGSLTVSGSGFVAPPIVDVLGTGMGASAISQLDGNGNITNILITSPGVGYTGTPTVAFTGGGQGAVTQGGSLATVNNTDGGLTKLGSGTLTLSGGYSYTGPTKVLKGTLILNSSLTLPYAGGDLLVSNATLSVVASSGVALPGGNVVLGTNAILNLTLNQYGNGILGSGALSFGTNDILNLNYGTLSGNPVAAINVAGALSTGSNVVINVSGAGFTVGQFPLIQYSGAPPANLASFVLGSLPPGVNATLVNDTGSQSIDLSIASIGQNLSWYGLLPDGVNVSSNWDITLTTNWVSVGTTTPALRYQEYSISGNTVGDPVLFSDTVYNDGINPQPTNINLTAAVHPFAVTFNSTLPYSITGSGGIDGATSIAVSNVGSVFLGTSNSFTGGVNLAAGTLIITNDSGLGASSGPVALNGGTLQVAGNTTGASRPFIAPSSASYIDVVSNVTASFGGTITGVGGITKIDDGTLVLTGTDTSSGVTTIRQGTAVFTGVYNPSTPSAGNGVAVSDTAQNGTLVISNYFNASRSSAPCCSVGGAANASGVVVVGTGGQLNCQNELWLGSPPTAGIFGFGALIVNGGSVTNGTYLAVGRGGGSAAQAALGHGELIMNSGSITVLTNDFSVGCYQIAPSSTCVATLNGGTVTVGANSTTGGRAMVGQQANGVLNINSGASVTVLNTSSAGFQFGAGTSASYGILNLNGGSLITPKVTQSVGTGILNFNGGTLKSTIANGSFMPSVSGGAYVYSGGGRIDNGGNAITIGQSLLAPPGSGVALGSLSVSGSGFIAPPIVDITDSGNTGTGASAITTIDANGNLTGVIITSPGINFSGTPNFTFTGGGVSASVTQGGSATTAANTSGGMTFLGAGTTTLLGSANYTGATLVSTGAVLVTPAFQAPGALIVSNGAAFGVTLPNTNASAGVGPLTLVSGSTSLQFGLGTNANSTVPLLVCGAFTNNSVCTIKLGAIASRLVTGSAIPVLQYSGTLQGSGSFVAAVPGPQGVSATVSNNAANSTVYIVINSAGSGIVWSGTNSAAGKTNLWDLNSTTNWLVGGVPTTYQEATPPGDAVTFNDQGTGVVLLSNTVSPAVITISNNAVNYTFSGPGHLGGVASLTKLGSGVATMSFVGNAYTGNTTISNGTLQAGSPSAIPSGAGSGNVVIGSGGTLDIFGNGLTFNALVGSGVVSNSTSVANYITIGSGDGNGTWAGSVTSAGGGGGIAFTKLGNGTEIITGTNVLNPNNTGYPSEVNAGSLILTNNSQFIVPATEFWIGSTAASTGAVVVAGGTLAVSNNWFDIGRGYANGQGSLIVNSGTVVKGGSSTAMVVGALGSQGFLTVNGGQVLVGSPLSLGDVSVGTGTLQLNGGLLNVANIFKYNATGIGTAYFNGGTLQANQNNANFIDGAVACLVQSNGLALDDNGYVINLEAPLYFQEDPASPGGGFIKKGAGTVYFDVGMLGTGTSIVTNGTLAGIGSVFGPMIVAPAGNIAPGDTNGIGTFTMQSQPLTLQGKATFRISKTGGTPANDQIVGISTANYGGTLIVANVTSDATPLMAGDTFPLFSASGSTGNFTSIIGSPGAGLTYSFDPGSGVLSVVTGTASNPTNISYTISGNTMTISWPADHLGWILQQQTNSLSAGLSTNWVDIDGTGSVTSTNMTINPMTPTEFYRLRHP